MGTVAATQASARVAALVCDAEGRVILLSLVGPDGACAAAFARLFAGQPVDFQPTCGVPLADKAADTTASAEPTARAAPSTLTEQWEGPTVLRRSTSPMKQFQTLLAGTRERHYLTLAALADLQSLATAGPPETPAAPIVQDTVAEQAEQKRPSNSSPAQAAQPPASPPPHAQPTQSVQRVHYVLGNAAEDTPAQATMLGHLRALRLPFLPTWVDTLWSAGQTAGMISPALALGIHAWRLEADLRRWSALLTEGVQAGWLAHSA